MNALSPLIFLCVCPVIAVLAIPLILGNIEMNKLYGFRTKKTLSNNERWQKANKFGGWAILISIMISVVLLVLLLIFGKKLNQEDLHALSTLFFAIPLVLGIIVTFVYIEKLP